MNTSTLVLVGLGLGLAAVLASPSGPGVAASAGSGATGTAAQLTRLLKPLEEQDWTESDKILASAPELRLEEVLTALRAAGWQPRCVYSWRTIKSQDFLYAKGWTEVTFSLHMAVGSGGEPAAMAADICDQRWGWGERSPTERGQAAEFFRALGRVAAAHGLDWGGNFSRKPKSVWTPLGLGWDPGHIEIKNGGSRLAGVRDASLVPLLGQGVVFDGAGGYRYRLWPGGPNDGPYVQILEGPQRRGMLYLPTAHRSEIKAILDEYERVRGVRLFT